ncbi:MAG: DinB family protein [Chloroflexota bacterium]
MRAIQKPQEGEFAPYTTMYISLLPDDGRVLDHMQENLQQTIDLARSFSDEALTTPNAEGEWTIKDILVHVADDERIFCYRALRFARNDPTELPGFDQDLHAANAGANARTLDDILEEYAAVRSATITLFKNLPEEALPRSGVSNDHRMSVRAAAYHIAGHELHHLNSIRENYL